MFQVHSSSHFIYNNYHNYTGECSSSLPRPLPQTQGIVSSVLLRMRQCSITLTNLSIVGGDGRNILPELLSPVKTWFQSINQQLLCTKTRRKNRPSITVSEGTSCDCGNTDSPCTQRDWKWKQLHENLCFTN